MQQDNFDLINPPNRDSLLCNGGCCPSPLPLALWRFPQEEVEFGHPAGGQMDAS